MYGPGACRAGLYWVCPYAAMTLARSADLGEGRNKNDEAFSHKFLP